MADKAIRQTILPTLLSEESTLYSDELAGYEGWPDHFTVCHGRREWA